MLRRLDARFPHVYRDTSGKASPKSDTWNVFLLSKVSTAADRAALASRNAGTVNAAYHSFIDEQIKRYWSVNALHDTFLEWFEGFQGNGTHLLPPSRLKGAACVCIHGD
jgi:hypothetical protein